MRRLLATSALGLATAGMLVVAVAPADAQFRGGRGFGGYHGGFRGGYGGYGYRGYGYRGYGAGTAVAAGILGLGVGAAIASSGHPYYGGYGGYGGYYDYGPAYYAPPPPPPAYGYGYGGYCSTDWRWDGYRGRYVRVRYCD